MEYQMNLLEIIGSLKTSCQDGRELWWTMLKMQAARCGNRLSFLGKCADLFGRISVSLYWVTWQEHLSQPCNVDAATVNLIHVAHQSKRSFHLCLHLIVGDTWHPADFPSVKSWSLRPQHGACRIIPETVRGSRYLIRLWRLNSNLNRDGQISKREARCFSAAHDDATQLVRGARITSKLSISRVLWSPSHWYHQAKEKQIHRKLSVYVLPNNWNDDAENWPCRTQDTL